jgi:hypothetical protein
VLSSEIVGRLTLSPIAGSSIASVPGNRRLPSSACVAVGKRLLCYKRVNGVVNRNDPDYVLPGIDKRNSQQIVLRDQPDRFAFRRLRRDRHRRMRRRGTQDGGASVGEDELTQCDRAEQHVGRRIDQVDGVDRFSRVLDRPDWSSTSPIIQSAGTVTNSVVTMCPAQPLG